MNRKDADRQEAIENLKKILKPGDTVHTVLRHVSRSGMQREIDLYYLENGESRWLSGYAARALDMRLGKREAIVIGGCGMDMGFELVYNLAYTLFKGDFHCLGVDGRCPANDHSNERDELKGYDPNRVHSDAGYALRHRWL